MPAVLDHLQLDHRNMRQLLQILEDEIEAYNSGKSCDFDMMARILEYTLHYPNLVHHPREEMLFRRLLELDPGSKGLVGDLTKDHEGLARLTHRFAAALHNVAHDVEVPRALFAKVAGEYLARSREHMDTEETKFFPRLLAVLRDEDWDDFNNLATRSYDPLFGTSIESHYKGLHERILSTVV